MTQPQPTQPPQYAAHPSLQPAGERPRKVLAIVAIAFAALAVLVGPVQAFLTMGLISIGIAGLVGLLSVAIQTIAYAAL